jgi:sulfite oxidase
LEKTIKQCGGLSGVESIWSPMALKPYFKKGEVMNSVVSVPWSKIKTNQVLLAWEVNGKPLPEICGYPLPAVIFGYIGARSVKYLYRIKAIPHPSRAPVQSREYLCFSG